MSVVFFARDGEIAPAEERSLPDGTRFQIWQARDKLPVSWEALRVAVKIQHKLGLFDDDRYSEIGIWDASTRVHRLIVTPRWHRFPFMADGDLQIGAVWTHPGWRQRGLARLAIARAHCLFAAPGQRFWYVTDSSNAASVALAQRAGYRLIGEGRRTKPIGIAMLGQFQVDREFAAA